VLTDALQHVDEVDVRVDTVESAGHQQALDDGYPVGTDFRPTKQPVPFFIETFRVLPAAMRAPSGGGA
jgi:hypothetical protein